MKCDRCGLQSDVEQAFSIEKHFLRGPKHYCPDCTVKRQARSLLMLLALMLMLGLFAFALDPSSRKAAIILDIGLVVLSFIPMIVIHELAHAGVARLLGMRVFGILIGVGKSIWSGKFFGINWVINRLPLSAITSVGTGPVSGARWRLFFVYLAGPASNALLAFLFYILARTLPISPTSYPTAIGLVVVNVILLTFNLLPRKVSVLTGMQGTDGWHLFRMPFIDDSELMKHYVGYYAAEALQSYAENDFEKASAWVDKALELDANSGPARNVQGIIQLARREYHDARETFTRLLVSEDTEQPGFRYILLNNIAYLDALLNDPSLLPEADEFSSEALKHLPWMPAVIGTRGTVLVELGQFEEGIELLKKAMDLHTDKQGKALNACHLALGEYRRGDANTADKYLSTAKTLDPECFLIPQVEAQVTKYKSAISQST